MGRLGKVHGVEVPGGSRHYKQEGFQGYRDSRGGIVGRIRSSGCLMAKAESVPKECG